MMFVGVEKVPQVDDLNAQYTILFSDSLGKMKGIQAKIDVKDGAKPKYFKAQPVPIFLQEKVRADITCLENGGILSLVCHSK